MGPPRYLWMFLWASYQIGNAVIVMNLDECKHCWDPRRQDQPMVVCKDKGAEKYEGYQKLIITKKIQLLLY